MSHRRTSWQERGAGRFGWRGIYLQAIGTCWVLIGLATVSTSSDPHSWVLFDYVPPWVRAIAWVVSGGTAVVVGRRGSDQDDSAGYVALYLVPATRCASYAVSWLAWAGSSLAHALVHHEVTVVGWQPALYPMFVWFALLGMLSIEARRPNPLPLPRPPDHAAEGHTP